VAEISIMKLITQFWIQILVRISDYIHFTVFATNFTQRSSAANFNIFSSYLYIMHPVVRYTMCSISPWTQQIKFDLCHTSKCFFITYVSAWILSGEYGLINHSKYVSNLNNNMQKFSSCLFEDTFRLNHKVQLVMLFREIDRNLRLFLEAYETHKYPPSVLSRLNWPFRNRSQACKLY
jgi:hypothetical protein